MISYDKIEDVKKSQRLKIPVELKYNNKSIPFNEINDMYCINTSSIFEETSSYLGSEALKGKDRIKVAVALMVPIVVLGVLFVVFGDSTLSFLNF